MAGLVTPNSTPDGGPEAPRVATSDASIPYSPALPAPHAPAAVDLSARALIPVFTRLKWELWKRSYRKNIGKIIGTIVGSLYACGALVSLVFAMLGATVWSGEGTLFPLIIRGLGVAAVALWFLIPVVAFGMDDTLDARLFALFPRRARNLQPGMFVASLLSLPTLFTVLALAIVTVFEAIWLLVFGHGAVQIILALLMLLPANIAGLALCVLLPRAWFAHSAAKASSRKGRELGGMLTLLLMLAVIYGGSLAMQELEGTGLLPLLEKWVVPAVTVACWTPFGALFAVPMDLADGAYVTAVGRLLIGALTIVWTWLWWRRSLDVALTSALTGDASSGAAKVTSLVPRFVRPTPFGASFGRSLKYWRRDTRYLAAVGVMPLVIAFMAVMGMLQPQMRPMGLAMVVFMLGALSITCANEIGFDGPAGWVNITAQMPSRANLLGRTAALACITAPLLVLTGVLVPVLYGLPGLIPLILLGVFGLSMSGWGVSAFVGTLFPYPTSPPGTNPMKDRSMNSTNALLTIGIGMGAIAVSQIPAAGIAVGGIIVGSLPLQLLAGAISVVVGAAVLWLGIRFGAKRLDARYPDLFHRVRDFV